MSRIYLIVSLLSLSVSFVECFGVNYWQFRKKVDERRRTRDLDHVTQKFMKTATALPSLPMSPFVDQFLEQPLDHFDAAVQGTYKQRFWVNQEHWDSPHGPVFLYVGGEGALSQLSVQIGEHVDLAKKYHALVVAVEHRFYGASINEDSLKLENLQYLSSQQALADLATFHRHISNKLQLTDINAWISFGGSYPGALSAWFRLKYPHLVYGAVASSAPVQAKVNFQGYNNVVAASLADPLVHGSVECALNVKEAFKKVDLLLCDHQYSKLADDFLSCDPLSSEPHDLYLFVANLADVFMGTVQYNSEAQEMNIGTICQMMNRKGDPYDNLRILNQRFLNSTEQKCADNSWKSFIDMVSNVSVTVEIGVGLRQWLYQTCTQFGYYQTCDENSTCLFSNRMSLQPNLDVCQEVFKVLPDKVLPRVFFTNDYYGSDRPKGTRIIFVNGSIDPWHALSVLEDLSASETAIFIPGTSHCANMYSPEATDPPALVTARQAIEKQIGEWLTDASQIKLMPYKYNRNPSIL